MRNLQFSATLIVALLGGGCSVATVLWSVFGFVRDGNEYFAIPLFWGLLGCALFLPMLAAWRRRKGPAPSRRASGRARRQNEGSAVDSAPAPVKTSDARQHQGRALRGISDVSVSGPPWISPGEAASGASPSAIAANTGSSGHEGGERDDSVESESERIEDRPAPDSGGEGHAVMPEAETSEELSTDERMEVRFMTVAGIILFGFGVIYAVEMTLEALATAAICIVLGLLCFRRLDKLLRR